MVGKTTGLGVYQTGMETLMKEDLIYRLRYRAEIRRQIPTRKSVLENQPDRIADLLEEAADALEELQYEQRTTNS